MMKPQKSSSRVIATVLMVAFGLLALVVGYATIKGGAFELRSKAATKEILLKQWTFDGGTQDWKANDWASQSVNKGVFAMVVDTKTEIRDRKEVCTGTKKRGNYKCRQKTVVTQLDPRFVRSAADTVLLYPYNRLKMKMSVLLKVPGDPYAKKLMVETVPFTLQYKIEGKNAFETPVQLRVKADGGIQEVIMEFPKDMSLKKVTDIKLSFTDIKSRANTVVSVDEVSIVGLKEVARGTKVMGTVSKVDGAPLGITQTGFVLRGSVEGQRDRRLRTFALIQGWDPVECPQGRACPQIARRVNINFEEFVGKNVIAEGTIGPVESQMRGVDEKLLQYIRENNIQILYVRSMTVDLPCQPVPEGCTDPNGAMMCKIGLMEGYRWCEPTPTPRPQVVGPGCEVAGCSGQLCVAAGSGDSRVTHCMYQASYACYKSATCEKQASGQCGWTMNQELAACIESASGPDYIEYRQGSRRAPAPEGCSYQQVQCIQAPCDSVLVCPTP